jgi:predicted nicotinamide N-methyase
VDKSPPSPCTLAGYPAAWSAFNVDVLEDDRLLSCAPVELFALADPDSAIDAAALLREAVIADPPYWALVWTGARAIAAVLETTPLDARTRVLDLGCGLGLSGIVAARRGGSVTFADYLEEPLDFVRASLERIPHRECSVRRIDFTAADDTEERFDLILAADIVYDPAHYAPLAGFLDRHLGAGGTILLTESLRADAGVFLAGLAARGISGPRRALWVKEDGRSERTWLHELRRGIG